MYRGGIVTFFIGRMVRFQIPEGNLEEDLREDFIDAVKEDMQLLM